MAEPWWLEVFIFSAFKQELVNDRKAFQIIRNHMSAEGAKMFLHFDDFHSSKL